jgi:hypothetical protein
MKRQARVAACVVVAIGTALYFGLRQPSPVNSQCLTFDVIPIGSSDDFRTFAVSVSNISESTVELLGDIHRIDFTVVYLTNGSWRTGSTQILTAGPVLVLPGQVEHDSIRVPAGAAAFKVGLAITSLTWRGRFAWFCLGSRFESLLHPIMARLIGQDERCRTQFEWSKDFQLPRDELPTNSAINLNGRL